MNNTILCIALNLNGVLELIIGIIYAVTAISDFDDSDEDRRWAANVSAGLGVLLWGFSAVCFMAAKAVSSGGFL